MCICLFSGLKQFGCITFIGLILVLGGETLRKLAMWTAKTNFNHYVQHIKADGHTLVTHGIYNYSRHPSYVGWFYWSVGTQVGHLHSFFKAMVFLFCVYRNFLGAVLSSRWVGEVNKNDKNHNFFLFLIEASKSSRLVRKKKSQNSMTLWILFLYL